MEQALQAQALVKTFGAQRAVDAIDMSIPKGAAYGFIGPSGAGKTTTIRLIMSILFPDSGTLSVLGKASALEAKHRIGYLPEERGVYRKMSVESFLLYLAELKGAEARGRRPSGASPCSSASDSPTSAGRSARISPRACCSGCRWWVP